MEKWLILGLLTLRHVYEMLLHLTSRRSAENPTPANVADVYDDQTYQTWKQYRAAKGRLGVVNTLLSWVIMAVLLWFNVYAAVAAWFPVGPFWQMLGVLLLDTLVSAAVGATISYVDSMVIEEKYGFNRTTVKTFVFDQLRGLAISLLLGLLLVGLLATLHNTLGDWLILLFALGVFLISLVISFLYPILSRVGNKFAPLEEGELKARLMGLLTKHGYQVKAIEVMDASRRTTKLNAYFTGFGKLKTIVLYDNLVNSMSTDEICAVFAHELGHGLHKDVLKMQIMNFGNMLLMAVTVWLTVRYPSLHQAFGFAGINYGFAYVLFGVGIGLVSPLVGILTNAYSRHAEYRADRQAVEEGYGEALVTGLKKLARENFSHLAPAKVLVVLEYNHPPLSERIAAIEK